MNAVTNAGPLIALGKLGLIHLLSQLYDPLLVPDVVYEEVVKRGLELGQPDAYIIQLAIARHELVVIEVETTNNIDMAAPLHRGERAAILLARQKMADWVLLDDQLAREQALQFGLHVKGTLGVIVEAHRRSFLSTDEVALVFEVILERDDIWISHALVHRVRELWRREAGSDLSNPSTRLR